jgi:hypothetical protein
VRIVRNLRNFNNAVGAAHGLTRQPPTGVQLIVGEKQIVSEGGFGHAFQKTNIALATVRLRTAGMLQEDAGLKGCP